MDQTDFELEGGAVPFCYSVPNTIQLLNTLRLTQKSKHSPLEVELGQSIPADFRESLLIHNVDILLSLKEEDSLASKQF
ncbi:hypothetical protein HRE53_27400 (plasmid) [Acaryochloris sp. 'Moss Beach']|uniref:hypothetical protein n=1 Tax=Acaryochloris sp. 'Moss Beach' TaxID=2740837 RepID=UPI001F2ADE8B|nr:hypothetical protein [Acaryochloris sp. 'Moss Beach']UJB72322.1 hypothetical protein HRE53_27400 [Acaryochloris sp. 'Moss Beach']